MQRHGHERIRGPILQPRVIESLLHPACEDSAEPELFSIFQTVDHLADDPAAAHHRDGAVKVKCLPAAVRAGEGRDIPQVGLGANLASWRPDFFDAFLAGPAQGNALGNRMPASRAMRRKKQRSQRIKKTDEGA